MHIYGKEDPQLAKSYFTGDLDFSHCAFARITVCGDLLRAGAGGVGGVPGVPAQLHSSSNLYITLWGYIGTSSLLYIYAF